MWELDGSDDQLPFPFVEFEADGTGLRTRGLRAHGSPEIHLLKPPPELEESAKALLLTLANYVIKTHRSLMVGQKVSHGYWSLMLRSRKDGDLEIFESTPDGSDYVQGAQIALCYWNEQSDVCRKFNAEFNPPRPDQMAAVSLGVFEGDMPVWGVRYVAPPHMSGWYLTCERFSGDVKDLRVQHLYHVTSRRPDLVPYLALPPGFRFEITNRGGTAMFDRQVLSDS